MDRKRPFSYYALYGSDLDKLAGKGWYCFLDGYSGYNQISIAPKDQEKTIFSCPYGTFAFRRNTVFAIMWPLLTTLKLVGKLKYRIGRSNRYCAKQWLLVERIGQGFLMMLFWPTRQRIRLPSVCLHTNLYMGKPIIFRLSWSIKPCRLWRSLKWIGAKLQSNG